MIARLGLALLLGCASASAQWLHDPVPYPTADGPRALAAADVDLDGHQDLLVLGGPSSPQPPVLTVLLGAGDGSFGSSVSFPLAQPAGGTTNTIGAADITGDGLPDLVSVDAFTQELRVYAGDGHGGFGAPTHSATHGSSETLVLGDLDLDGWIDAVATNGFGNNLSVMHNGAGTLTATALVPLGGKAARAFIAPFDAGAAPDVLVLMQFGPNALLLLPGTGGGALGAPQNVYSTFGFDAGPADLDADGDLDLVQAHGTLAGANFLDTLRNDGSGHFNLIASLPVGGKDLRALAVADFNLDGAPDAVLSSYTDQTLRTARGDGAGALIAGPLIPVASFPFGLLTAELSGDGRPDLVVSLPVADAALVLTANDGRLRLQSGGEFATGVSVGATRLGDLDGDGDADAVLLRSGSNELRRLLGNGAGGFGAPLAIPAGGGPLGLDLGDVDGDGNLDLAVGLVDTDSVALLLGDGAGGFGAPLVAPALDGSAPVWLRDFDGDGRLDVLVNSLLVPAVMLLPGNGAGGLLAPATIPLPTISKLGVGDLDGDFIADFVSGEAATGGVRAWLDDGAGHFTPQALVRTGTAPASLLVQDLDDDGLADVAATIGSNPLPDAAVAVLHGDGAGGLLPPTQVPAPYLLSLGAADLDGDGRPELAGMDLALYTGSSPVQSFYTLHVLAADGAGGFTLPSVAADVGGSSSFDFADLDGDGRRDVAVVDDNSGQLAVLLNASEPHPWHDVGSALAGVHGPPALTGVGWAQAGSAGALELRQAAAQAIAVLFVSPVSNPTPFKGGVLLPVPPVIATPLLTDVHGAFTLGWTSWPPLTTGSTYWLQAAIADAAAPHGVALSNGLQLIQP